jgi:hypothetical protein
MPRQTGRNQYASQWVEKPGACECCGGHAWVIAGALHPTGGNSGRLRTRCDRCRKMCRPAANCDAVRSRRDIEGLPSCPKHGPRPMQQRGDMAWCEECGWEAA